MSGEVIEGGSFLSRKLRYDELMPDWLNRAEIRPYVFMRKENRIEKPGTLHDFTWFRNRPLEQDPIRTENVHFYNRVLYLDELTFGGAGLGMPRWVFYDCAIIPGVVSGFAIKKSHLPPEMKKALKWDEKNPHNPDWVPLSLFITIPCLEKDHWMAHNLCSINELLPESAKLKGLGFLSKAFGLWWANVDYLMGVTQWKRPALKLHANYGDFELRTAYTPMHTYAESLTYRLKVNADYWHRFFDKKWENGNFEQFHEKTELFLRPHDTENLIDIQNRIERGEGPFFLNGREILKKPLGEALHIFITKDKAVQKKLVD